MNFKDITLADVSVETKVETLGIALDSKVAELEQSVSSVTKQIGPVGPKGDKGDRGPSGIDGKPGRDGLNGSDGKAGADGKDGIDGINGISVVDASIAADNSLVLTLSDGSEIDAGVIETGGGTSTVNLGRAPTVNTVYAVRYDEISASLAYRGEAAIGSIDSAPVWRIQKIEIVANDVTITWANGSSSFTNAWTNRLSFTYL